MSLSHDRPQPHSPRRLPAGPGDCDSLLRALARLAVSSDPTVVFSSLAAVCVPAFCDECTVSIGQAGEPGGTGGSGSPARRDGSSGMPVWFAIGIDGDPGTRCVGVVTYTWHRATPSATDRVVARLLTDRAAALVDRERRIAAAERAGAAIANLKAGLVSNRQVALAIGILMATHKLEEPDAFAMLQLASQRSHRKVRDIADDVVLTGAIQQPPHLPWTGR